MPTRITGPIVASLVAVCAAPLPMRKLLDGNYAIVVRTSPADGNLEIYCGDVR